jgi:hypothetical protein
MSAEVINFQTREGVVGDGSVIAPSVVAASAAEVCTHLVCIGYNAEGGLEVFASHGVPQSFLLASQGAAFILNATGRAEG